MAGSLADAAGDLAGSLSQLETLPRRGQLTVAHGETPIRGNVLFPEPIVGSALSNWRA